MGPGKAQIFPVKVLVWYLKGPHKNNAVILGHRPVILSEVCRVFCGERSRKPALSEAEGDLRLLFNEPRFHRTKRLQFILAQREYLSMVDLLIGLAFLAMVLMPAIIASFHQSKADDRER